MRSLGATLVAALAAMLLASGSVMAADPACSVSVAPRAAVGGSVFTFTGSGFTPTSVLLQKANGVQVADAIDVGEADPWQLNIQSRVGDEGSWTATFVAEGGCSVSVTFQVTLASTDAISNLIATQPSGSLPGLFYLLVVGFGLTGGAYLSRRLAAARSEMRH